MKKAIPLLAIVALASCSYFKKGKTPGEGVLARVNHEYLYLSDVQSVARDLTGPDSVEMLKNYATNWVRKKLLLQKAIENIPEEDFNITKKVEEYRESLLLYEYEKALINQKLDTAINDAELNEWYEKLKPDFLSEKDVYLLYFIKLKKGVPNLNEARKWIMKPKTVEDTQKLEGYCREFAEAFILDKGVWHDKESLLKNFPLDDYTVSLLSNSNAFREFKKDDEIWFIRIGEVVKKDQPSPIALVKDKIVRVIIEKRRLKLLERTYNRIYDDGIKSKSFELFVKNTND